MRSTRSTISAAHERFLKSGFLLAMLIVAPLAPAHAQRGEDTVPRTHVLPALGIHAGAPQKASAAIGVVLGEDWQKNGREHSRNVALWAEPGLGAGRVSLAYVDHGYGTFGSGFGIGPSVIRTWKDPWTVHPNLSFVGGDLFLWPILFVGPRIGLFRNVGGPPGTKLWLVTLDFGIGL